MRLLIQPLKTRDIPAFFQKTTKILRNLWNHRCVFNFHLQNRPNAHFFIKPLGFAVVARNWPTQGFVLEWIRRTHAHVKARWENVIKRYFSSYTLTHPYAPIRTYTHPYAPNRTNTHSKPHLQTQLQTHLKTHTGARKSRPKIAQKMECKISGRHSFKYI